VPSKEPEPTVIFVGRLKRAKLPHHALQAFSIVKREMPRAKMWVVGDGYMRNELVALGIADVTFFGHVSNNFKNELISKAHLLIVPGVREGWGLVVTEANAMGTPAVGYDIPGLRDSIKNHETGTLTQENSPHELALTAINLLKDPILLSDYSQRAIELSRQFSWTNTAKSLVEIIKMGVSRGVLAE